MDNKLYVTITIKNEAGISSRVNAASRASTGTHNTPTSDLSIADLLSGVKNDTGDFVKYFPDSMLDNEQLAAKENAIAREEAKLADMKYEYAVENGDDGTVRKMLRDSAKKKG